MRIIRFICFIVSGVCLNILFTILGAARADNIVKNIVVPMRSNVSFLSSF
jgi:hypothetical protein